MEKDQSKHSKDSWKEQVDSVINNTTKKDNYTIAPRHEGYDLKGQGPNDKHYNPRL